MTICPVGASGLFDADRGHCEALGGIGCSGLPDTAYHRNLAPGVRALSYLPRKSQCICRLQVFFRADGFVQSFGTRRPSTRVEDTNILRPMNELQATGTAVEPRGYVVRHRSVALLRPLISKIRRRISPGPTSSMRHSPWSGSIR